MRSRHSVVALAMALVLTACGGAPAPESGEPSPSRSAHAVDGITATVVQYTRDRPARVVQVKLTNTSDEALDVMLVEPRFKGFTAQTTDRAQNLDPDRRVDLPVMLGEPSCDTPAQGSSAIVVHGTDTDGVSVRRSVPIDDDDGLLPQLHDLECDVVRVEEAVDITVDDTWEQIGQGADAAVSGHVTMALRPGGGSARVTGLDAGLLLRVTSGSPEPDAAGTTYMVDGEQPRTEWDIELVGARCDGHALAESRRLMALTFLVSVDGAEPVALRRSPDVDGYETMVAALLERCEHQGRGG